MKATIYLHGSKESNYDKGKELGLSEEALAFFVYACYEVVIEGEVNPQTGSFKITAVDGRRLEPK